VSFSTTLESPAMFFLFLAGMVGFQSDDSTQKIDFLRLSYKANKDAFAFGTFRFEYTRGRAASRPEAESEVFSQAIKEDGMYVFNGKNAGYDLLAEPGDLAAVTTRINDRLSGSFAKVFRALTDGEVTFLDLLSLDKENKFSHHAPEMYPGTEIFYSDGFFEFPL
jgi:hypothetical protein